MSAIAFGRSFSLVRVGKNLHGKTLDQHVFPFDAGDMSLMQGKLSMLAEMGGVPGVAASLRTDMKSGLFQDEVDQGFAKRNAVYGINVIEKPPLKSFFEHAWDALQDPMLLVLCIAAALSCGVGAADDPDKGWFEGLAILVAVILVSCVTGFNNHRQEREFRKLDESREEDKFTVWRGGQRLTLGQSLLVVGDVVELSAGDAIPADGLLITGDDPACNEAKMTGESKDIEKNSKSPFMMGGTELKKGQAMMLITSVGVNTTYGRILMSLVAPQESTPLQEKLEDLGKLIGKLGAVFAIALFVTLVIRWMVDVIHNEKKFVDEARDLISYFIISVTILVVAIPEGLPLAVTVSLAYSMKKMEKDQNLVRVLSACETMGNATAICSDKTGTLTTNRMTVMKGWVAGRFHEDLDDAPAALMANETVKKTLIEGVIVNSKASREQHPDTKEWQWKGNQTEVALLEFFMKYQLEPAAVRSHYIVEKTYPFDSMKKNSSIILRHKVDGHKGYRRYFKGAGEVIFGRCQLYADENGQVHEMVGVMKDEIANAIDRMTRTGLRTIAVSFQDFADIAPDANDASKLGDPAEDQPMVFVGVVGIKDPLRKESRASVRACQRAGIVVRMVTGDHPETARFIATECGILTSARHTVMTGDEFRQLMSGPPDAIKATIPWMRVLARSKPEDKQLLVRWLKEQGEVVAATGDGTNDAPALKEAHVGLAMNLVGTAVAKAAAHILILDDNFHSIVKSVMWGRCVFDNIRKFCQFQLTINIVCVLLTLIGALSGYDTPIRPIQLLWVNLIMDTLAALALGTEAPTDRLLQRMPYPRGVSIISPSMKRFMLGHVTWQMIVLLILLYAGDNIFNVTSKSEHHYTIIFNAFVWMQIFNEVNSRKVNDEHNILENFFQNGIFSYVIIATVIGQYLMVQHFGGFAKTHPLDVGEWFACIGIGFTSIPVGIIIRFIPIDYTAGQLKIDPATFEGAQLDKGDAFLPDPAKNVLEVESSSQHRIDVK